MGILLPKKFEKLIPSIEVLLNQPEDSRIAYIHFYNPIGAGDWYVLGGDKTRTGWLFYGVIVFSKARLDYFSMEELKKKRLPFNLEILRDEEFEAISWKKLSQSIERP